MQTFCVEIGRINEENLQASMNRLDEMVKEASYLVLNKGNIYHEKKFYRRVTCIHDTVIGENSLTSFLIRAVEFEDPYINDR